MIPHCDLQHGITQPIIRLFDISACTISPRMSPTESFARGGTNFAVPFAKKKSDSYHHHHRSVGSKSKIKSGTMWQIRRKTAPERKEGRKKGKWKVGFYGENQVQICQRNRRIGCVIPCCKLKCGITQPIHQLLFDIIINYS